MSSSFTKRFALGCIGLVGVAGILLAGFTFLTKWAQATESFDASSIMSDGVFTNKNSMSRDQIQSFLESKGSTCLSHFTTLSINDTNNDGLGDEPYGKGVNEKVTAATAIWQAAQLYGINPQVILATLQKEQGLVTRGDCPDWRYNTALGYGCPDSEPCDISAYGFTRQIDYGVWHFRGFFDDTYPVPPTVPGNKFIAYNPDVSRCGGSTITIQNRATAALYSYTPYQPNAATLAAAPGQLVDCGAYGNINFWRYFTAWFGSTQHEESLLLFKSHISTYGWTGWTKNRGKTGFTGQRTPMEAFKVNGEAEYSSYSYATGWQPTVNKGMVSGTTSQAKPIQAIRIKPTGGLAGNYDIYYRAHVSDIGWMGWAKNGDPAGVTGDANKSIESFEIQVIAKGFSAPGSAADAYRNNGTTTDNFPLLPSVTAHVSDIGWQPTVTNSMTAGTTEQKRRLEGLTISLNNLTSFTGSVTYSAHVEGIGWQDVKKDGEIAGTVGQAKRTEAIRLALTGTLGNNYDIWYRAHIQEKGWMGWAKNGGVTGSIGAKLRLEAVDVRIVPKNTISLPQDNNIYNPKNRPLPDSYSLAYSAHVSSIGWMGSVPQNSISGTTGQSRSMEAIKINTLESLFGDVAITCSAYVKSSGWVGNVTTGNTCGTTGQSKPIEAVRLALSGGGASKYDLYYKVHTSQVGWGDWITGNNVAGAPDSGKPVEAVIVKLVEK